MMSTPAQKNEALTLCVGTRSSDFPLLNDLKRRANVMGFVTARRCGKEAMQQEIVEQWKKDKRSLR